MRRVQNALKEVTVVPGVLLDQIVAPAAGAIVARRAPQRFRMATTSTMGFRHGPAVIQALTRNKQS